MKLDVGTLFAIAVPLGFVCGLLHFAFWLRWRERALLWWGAADWVGTAGALLLLSRAARVPGNTVLVASSLMVWAGFRCFAGQSLPLRAFALATVAFLAGFLALRTLVPDLALAVVYCSVAFGLIRAGMALDLGRVQLPDPYRVRRLLAVMFVLHALFYLFRSTTAAILEASAEFLDTGGLQAATLLFGLFDVLVWNLAALWLVGHRRQLSRSVAPAA